MLSKPRENTHFYATSKGETSHQCARVLALYLFPIVPSTICMFKMCLPPNTKTCATYGSNIRSHFQPFFKSEDTKSESQLSAQNLERGVAPPVCSAHPHLLDETPQMSETLQIIIVEFSASSQATNCRPIRNFDAVYKGLLQESATQNACMVSHGILNEVTCPSDLRNT